MTHPDNRYLRVSTYFSCGSALFFLLVLGCSVASGSLQGAAGLLQDPEWDPENLPASAGALYTSSSSSFTSLPAAEDDDSSATGEIPVTSISGALSGDTPTTVSVHLQREGTLVVTCQSGTGIEIFSRENGEWPNTTFRSDYGASDMVTPPQPLTRTLTAGTWYFALFPLGEEATYTLTARQNAIQVAESKSGSPSSASIATSMGVVSFSGGS